MFLAPALSGYTTRVYRISEPLITDGNSVAADLSDPQIKATIQNTFQDSKDSIGTQIEVLGFFYQYAWFFIITITAFILLIFSRLLVEKQVGGVA